MAGSFRFIHGPDDVYYVESNDVYDYGKGNCTRLGIPSPETVYKASQDDYNAKHVAAKAADRKKTAPAERDAARVVLTAALKDYGNQHLFFNHNLTGTDRTMFHFHEDKTPSTIYPPEDPPIIVVKNANRKVSLWYYELPGGKALAKPHGVTACIARWVKSPTKPAHISELVNEAVGTSKEIVLHFDESERGETIWVAASWQIERDRLESPSTDMIMVVIS